MPFTGVSVVSDGSSTAITADGSSGYHLLVFEGYSRAKSRPTGQSIASGGYDFCIRYYPNGDRPENAEFVSVYVGLYNAVALAKPVKTQFQISFVDEIEMQESTPVRPRHVFEIRSRKAYVQIKRFIKREDLEKSKYLKDDSFTFRCDVIMVDDDNSVETDTHSPPCIEVPPPEIHQHFSDLLLSEEGTDMTFDVSGEKIAAHQCVLAARSPVFKTQLFVTMKEGLATTSVIEVDDINAPVFRAMLSFIYSDSLPEIQDEDQDVVWQHLLVAADRYDLRRLMLMCEERLCEYLDASMVPTILTLAEQHNCGGLKERCLDFLNSPTGLVRFIPIPSGLRWIGAD